MELLWREHVKWEELQAAKNTEVFEDEVVDEDGAVVFEGIGRESRPVNLPPDVPVPQLCCSGRSFAELTHQLASGLAVRTTHRFLGRPLA